MFFTREDILKIQQALLQLGVKDSELPSTEYVTYDDTLSIVQEGKNRKIEVKDFFNQISLWKKEDFLNITDKYDKHYISLRDAINSVPVLHRKDGLVITFQDTDGNWRIYQFRGNITEFLNKEKWLDLYDYKNYIVQSIVPDEEDLTASIPDENGNSLVHLKDRVYNSAIFNGKGYKFIRKNIINIELTTIKISVINPTTLEGNISFNINNKGTDIHLSPTIHNTTKLVAEAIKDTLTTTYTDYKVTVANNIVTLTRKYSGNTSPTTFEMYNTGVGVIVEDSTIIEERNIITQEDISEENTIYEIRYDFDLDGKTITIPNNCVLYFTSGKFYNGSINMDNTIVSTLYENILSEVSINGNYYNIQKHIKDHQSQLDDKQAQIDDKQQQITANDEDISLLQTRSTQMEETIKSIAATGGASQATAVTYNNEKSGLIAINAQAAIDEVNSKLSDLFKKDAAYSSRAKLDGFIKSIEWSLRNSTDKQYYPLDLDTLPLSGNIFSLIWDSENDISFEIEFSYEGDTSNTYNGIKKKDVWRSNGNKKLSHVRLIASKVTKPTNVIISIYSPDETALVNTAFKKENVVKTVGNSDTSVMSQNAVTSIIADTITNVNKNYNGITKTGFWSLRKSTSQQSLSIDVSEVGLPTNDTFSIVQYSNSDLKVKIGFHNSSTNKTTYWGMNSGNIYNLPNPATIDNLRLSVDTCNTEVVLRYETYVTNTGTISNSVKNRAEINASYELYSWGKNISLIDAITKLNGSPFTKMKGMSLSFNDANGAPVRYRNINGSFNSEDSWIPIIDSFPTFTNDIQVQRVIKELYLNVDETYKESKDFYIKSITRKASDGSWYFFIGRKGFTNPSGNDSICGFWSSESPENENVLVLYSMGTGEGGGGYAVIDWEKIKEGESITFSKTAIDMQKATDLRYSPTIAQYISNKLPPVYETKYLDKITEGETYQIVDDKSIETQIYDTVLEVKSQESFNAIPSLILKSLTDGKSKILCLIYKGKYRYSSFLTLQNIQKEDAIIDIIGIGDVELIAGTKTISIDSELSQKYSSYYSSPIGAGLNKKLNFVSENKRVPISRVHKNGTSFFALNGTVEYVSGIDDSFNLYRIETDLDISKEEGDSFNSFLCITRTYLVAICKIIKIEKDGEKNYIYFSSNLTLENLNMQSQERLYSIYNLSDENGEISVCNNDVHVPYCYDYVHICEDGEFLNISDSKLKRVSVSNIHFIGSTAEDVMNFTNLEAMQIWIEGNKFSASYNTSILNVSNTDNFTFVGNEIKEHYGDILRCHGNNAFIYNNIVENLYNVSEYGAGNFAFICSGNNYHIHNNTIKNFTYGAIGVGAWLANGEADDGIERKGIVEFNHIYCTDEFIRNNPMNFSDKGAIYLWTKNNAYIRHNVIHGIYGFLASLVRVIFCDNGASNFTIYGNLIANTIYYKNCIESRRMDLENFVSNSNNYIGMNIVPNNIYIYNRNNTCRVSHNIMFFDKQIPSYNGYSGDTYLERPILMNKVNFRDNRLIVTDEQYEVLKKYPFSDYVKGFIKKDN